MSGAADVHGRCTAPRKLLVGIASADVRTKHRDQTQRIQETWRR